ncbi:hypothetical protein ICV35_22645 [Rhodococcus ruber]|uniref:ParB family protein n=1 Tax=Rhodococcus ruber TaxID=1830 RepID=UPI0017803784|nr:hypothetical protein [Rhodococcus ruber]MBD8056455.1 hypothetical protein [Rhodococcus ruber]
MSEKQRKLTGLPRRANMDPRPVTGDLSGMLAKNRDVAPSPQPHVEQPAEASEPKQAKKAMTVYIPQDVYTRARLAFNATRTSEADRNWSQFVEKAIAEEVRRREKLYNTGEAFEGVDAPLSPGRPLSED